MAAKGLALLSVATFWLLPFSPFVAMAALAATKRSVGWPRKLAIVAALLCVGYTIAIALLLYCITIYILNGGLDRPPNAGLLRYY
jgi:hypothetical protein